MPTTSPLQIKMTCKTRLRELFLHLAFINGDRDEMSLPKFLGLFIRLCEEYGEDVVDEVLGEMGMTVKFEPARGYYTIQDIHYAKHACPKFEVQDQYERLRGLRF